MAGSSLHLARAEHNRELYTHLESVAPLYIDWQVIVLFYAALQYVDAYLATKGVHPHDHKERESWVVREARLKTVASEYDDLLNRSKDARYNLVVFPNGLQHRLHDKQFTKVRALVLGEMPPTS